MHPLTGTASGLSSAAIHHWSMDPLIVLPLGLSAVLYAIGTRRLWRRAGTGSGISLWSALSFCIGWLIVATALLSPIAWVSQILFSIHMTQHMLLMLVGAPLMAFGHPLLAWLWVFDERGRKAVGAFVTAERFTWCRRTLSAPLWMFLLQAVTLWVWHIPSWYEAALRHDSLHALQHLSFVFAASLFWWVTVQGRYGRMGYGLGVLYVFLTAVHSSALGALITVAPSLWYRSYEAPAGAWGFDAAADQQLAGLLMWIPAGTVFIVFGLALFAAWLGEAGRRVRFGIVDASSRPLIVALLICASALSACASRGSDEAEAEALTGGSIKRGEAAIGKYGCGGCHSIAGYPNARGNVGPPLDRIAMRQYLGGRLPNTPGNLMKWIQHPQEIAPRSAMPDLNVTDGDAKDIAALLYTLR